MAKYTVEFETLAEESGFNEPALLVAFRRGLNDQLRAALIAVARPRDLAEMIDRAIELDNFQQERRRERSRWPSPTQASSSPPTAPPPLRGEEPLQLGGARLSHSEQRRRLVSSAS